MTTLTLEEFGATKRTPTDELWAEMGIWTGLPPDKRPLRDACHLFGGPDDGYLVHEAEGKFWVHAWWYNPLPYATMEEAVPKLYDWYCEWTS